MCKNYAAKSAKLHLVSAPYATSDTLFPVTRRQHLPARISWPTPLRRVRRVRPAGRPRRPLSPPQGCPHPLGVEEPGFKCSECREKIHGGRPVVYLLAADNSQV